MKKLLFSLLVSISSIAFSQDVDCQKFKYGNFVIPDSTIGNTLLERKGSKQFEYVEKLGVKTVYKVKWINDCTYTLQRKKIVENPTDIDFPKDLIITIEIIETRSKSYIAKITSNLYDMVLEVEIFQIE